MDILAGIGLIIIVALVFLKKSSKKSISNHKNVSKDISENENIYVKKQNKDNEKYYLCFQNKSYYEEKMKNILWAPHKDNRGKMHHSWKRMYDLKPGDIVISYKDRSFIAVNEVESKVYDLKNPFQNKLWNQEGIAVDLHYKEYNFPLEMNDKLFDEFKQYLPEKYSPFSSNGKGNQGYLYLLPEEAAKLIINRLIGI